MEQRKQADLKATLAKHDSSAHENSPLHLLDLPLSVLEKILAYAVRGPALNGSAMLLSDGGAEDGLPCVCKRVREAYDSAAVWRSASFVPHNYIAGESNLDFFLQALQRRGGFFQELSMQLCFGDMAHACPTAADVLAYASPSLKVLTLEIVHEPNVFPAMSRFGQLQKLKLESCTVGGFAAHCGALTSLHTLWLEDSEDAEEPDAMDAMPGISSLTALTRLYLSTASYNAHTLQFPPLGALGQLRSLNVNLFGAAEEEDEEEPYTLALDFSPLTSLRSLTLTSRHGFLYNDFCAAADDSLLALPRLEELRLVGFRVPSGERAALATTSLRTLVMAQASCGGINAAAISRQPRLRDLQLVGTSTPGSAWGQFNFSRCTDLTTLVLTDLYSEESRPALPAGVTALTGLRRLHLINCSLGELPPGPYLSSLTELALTKNRVRALPAHLKQATALQALCLGDNYQLNLSDYISNDTMNALVKRSLRRVCYQSIQGTGPHGAVAVENAHSVAEYERYMRSMQALVRSHAKKIEVDVSRSLAENEWAHFVSKPDF